jgi:hypothetical protein
MVDWKMAVRVAELVPLIGSKTKWNFTTAVWCTCFVCSRVMDIEI